MSLAVPIMSGDERVGTLCRAGRMERIVDWVDGEPRWCFHCRKVREFRYTVDREIEPSYYGPNPAIRCAVCDTYDGDCFPGYYRTWGD